MMEFTLIQVQSLIICAVIILTALIVWPFAIKIEKEEEKESRRRIKDRYNNWR